MSRVLVTGATGFIGRHVPPLLEGRDVVAVGSRDADLLAPGEAERLIDAVRPSHLLHLAWDATPGRFWTTPDNIRWAEASLRLLRAFREGGGERAVMAGTCAEYAWGRGVHCVEDETPVAPATLYGVAKDGVRSIGEKYAETTGLSFAWGRIFFVFGTHEHPARLVSSVASALVRGEPAEVGPGTAVRDFLFAEDVAAAFCALLDSDVLGAVNIASGAARTIREVVEQVALAAGRPELLLLGARPGDPAEPDAITAAVHRLRADVGWSPAASFEERIEETVGWWRGR